MAAVDPLLLAGEGLLGLLAGGHRRGERVAVARDCLLDLLLLGAHLGGLGLEGLRVPAGPLVLGLGREVAHPLRRESPGPPEPLAQGGQAVPGLLRAGQGRGLRGRGLLEGPLAGGRLGQLGLDLGPPRAQGGLVGDLRLQAGGELDQVVGQQPQPRVAQVGLDDRRPPRDLGLAAERLELAAQLDREVLHPGQVGLHRVELAESLLLALAVLEDARGLLDEAAALVGAGGEHGVELALPDDDVHLAPDARVGEQLLDVEQAAGVAVDRVLRAAVAEHDPRDGDLGVVDRQRPVGVVDREADLGAPERRPPCPRRAGRRRRPGEDDVLHLAAAQRLGALLAHDPGEGVDDVGLARAVRPDDAGDARLEVEGRRRREGLEALEGEALQVHAGVLLASRHRGRRAGRVRSGRTSGGEGRGHPTRRRAAGRPGAPRGCGASGPGGAGQRAGTVASRRRRSSASPPRPSTAAARTVTAGSTPAPPGTPSVPSSGVEPPVPGRSTV